MSRWENLTLLVRLAYRLGFRFWLVAVTLGLAAFEILRHFAGF